MADKNIQELQAELVSLQIEEARIKLEQTRENIAEWKGKKEVGARQNAQRQGQLKADHVDRAAVIGGCTHRQGGSPGRERKGAGPSALRVVILPDDRTLVMCANCPMRVFSPLPTDKNPERRAGESAADAKARVTRYQAELEEFEALVALSQDQLTPEAGAPMHCGKQFSFVAGNGNNVTMPAPCDTYAQGRDNRHVA
ncbi:MAG: hypothetical protein WBQ94_04360 [Terracidiphilus sp.]